MKTDNDIHPQTDVFNEWFVGQMDELDRLRKHLSEVRATARKEIEEATDTARERESEIMSDYDLTIQKAARKLSSSMQLSSDKHSKEMKLYNKPVQAAQEALQAFTEQVYAQAREKFDVDFEAMLEDTKSLEGVA